MKLYHDPRSRSVRVQVLLEELGVDHELVAISLERREQRSEEHRRRHPLGQLPVLEHEGQTSFESVAICLYLADRFADRAPLAPSASSPDRAIYYQWCLFVPGSLEPAMLRTYLEATGGGIPPGVPPLDAVLDVLATSLTARDYLLSSGISTADVVVGATLIHGERMGISLPAALEGYVARLSARPSFAEAFGR